MLEVVNDETGDVVRRPARPIDHPAEQAVFEHIRELRSQGKGLRAIARVFDVAGLGCPERGRFHSTIKAFLARAG